MSASASAVLISLPDALQCKHHMTSIVFSNTIHIVAQDYSVNTVSPVSHTTPKTVSIFFRSDLEIQPLFSFHDTS